jgi:hypothetical protein
VDELAEGHVDDEIEAAGKDAREAMQRLRVLAQRAREQGPE